MIYVECIVRVQPGSDQPFGVHPIIDLIIPHFSVVKVSFALETWGQVQTDQEPWGNTHVKFPPFRTLGTRKPQTPTVTLILERLYKDVRPKVNFVLETSDHLRVHQDLLRHTSVTFTG